MANTVIQTYAPATGAEAMWAFVTHLKANGWLSKMDSDGTTYSSTGTKLTHGGTGPKGLGNPRAWSRLHMPDAGGAFEITIQHALDPSDNFSWRIKYNAAIPIDGGAPDATTTPSAAGDMGLRGGGTDGAPTFAALFGADGTYSIKTIVQSDTNYDFALFAYDHSSTGDTNAFLVKEQVYSALAAYCDQGPLTLATQAVSQLDVSGTPPVISNVDPPTGTRIPREATITFDVTDNIAALGYAIVVADFPDARISEVVHDGTTFTYHYSAQSTRSVITGGFRYSLRRDTGWPVSPVIRGFFVDSSGNFNV